MATPTVAAQQPISPFFPHGFPLVSQPPAERPAASAEVPAKWTSEEHSKFLKALEDVVDSSDGSDWQAIAQAVGRPEADVKRHAQHYFLKLEHERSIPEDSIVQVPRAPPWVPAREPAAVVRAVPPSQLQAFFVADYHLMQCRHAAEPRKRPRPAVLYGPPPR